MAMGDLIQLGDVDVGNAPRRSSQVLSSHLQTVGHAGRDEVLGTAEHRLGEARI